MEIMVFINWFSLPQGALPSRPDWLETVREAEVHDGGCDRSRAHFSDSNRDSEIAERMTSSDKLRLVIESIPSISFKLDSEVCKFCSGQLCFCRQKNSYLCIDAVHCRIPTSVNEHLSRHSCKGWMTRMMFLTLKKRKCYFLIAVV